MAGSDAIRYSACEPCRVFHMSSTPARTKVALLLISMALASGCASNGPTEVSRPVDSPSKAASAPAAVREPESPGELAAAVAVRQIGVPYRYGGQSRRGFDCSGLVHYAYGQIGVRTPRTTAALWRELAPVPPGHLRVGDVLFFDIAGKVSHVGLYLGDGRFVHAPSSGRSVSLGRLDQPFYREAFLRAGRL